VEWRVTALLWRFRFHKRLYIKGLWGNACVRAGRGSRVTASDQGILSE
jgi:hypothetical protein